VTVTPDYVFRVSNRLRDEFQNGRSYYGLDGAKIAVPERELWRPKRESPPATWRVGGADRVLRRCRWLREGAARANEFVGRLVGLPVGCRRNTLVGGAFR
jgi:hypothetical protein